LTNVTEEEKRGDDEDESGADEIDSEKEEPGPAAAPTKVAAGGNDDDDDDDEDDGGEDNTHDDTGQPDSLKQPLLILKKITGKCPSGLEVSKSVTIANGRLVQIPQVWDKAYPRTHVGKATILADQAIPEELQPSTIPNEGTVDTKTHA
jgi:hypothetical protein